MTGALRIMRLVFFRMNDRQSFIAADLMPRGSQAPMIVRAGASFPLLAAIGLIAAAIWTQPAMACAGPHCDPNWAFQNQMLAQRAQEEQQMEMHRRQMDMYYAGADGSTGAPAAVALRPPPQYRPPPPPKGWQQRFTGFVTFKVSEDEDRDDARFRYDYAIAMNYPTAEEAKAAAARMCRDRVLRSWESYDIDHKCEEEAYVYRDAFISLVTYWNGKLGIYEQPTLDLAVNQHGRAIEMAGRTYYCADLSRPTPDTCQAWLFGVGRNGVHREPGRPSDYRLFTCPGGAPGSPYKIVGVDRLSGQEVPLCGPDPAAFAMQDRAGRWDAYATHPHYVIPFAAGGFSDLPTARGAVLEMCNRFTGGGCIAAGEARDGFAAWVRNEEGQLFLGTGADESMALADARRRCQPQLLLPCKKVMSRIAGDLRVYGPRVKLYDRRYYGAAALPGGKVGSDRTAWVAYNMDTQADADRYAIEACQRENSGNRPCQVVGRGLSTSFHGYSGLDGSTGIFTLLVKGSNKLIDPENREAAMLEAICKSKGTHCKSVGSLGASDEGIGAQAGIATLKWPTD